MNSYELKYAPVTAIVPCYKAAETIERAVHSIANQTLVPKEVILVDDYSGDQTLELIKNLKKKYGHWIKLVLLNKNHGVAIARNIGWDQATQKYIAFLDADDAWHPNKIEVQYTYMESNPDVFLSGHEHLILSNQESVNWKIGQLEAFTLSSSKLLISNPFVTPSVMIRNDIRIRFNVNKRYMEDYLLWQEIILEDLKVTKIKLPLAALYKPAFGCQGLSSHIWSMGISDIHNYWILFKTKKINILKLIFYASFATIKFFRRAIIVWLRRW